MKIVLLYDEKETDQEFEARFMANLPNWAVGSLLLISDHRHRVVHDGLKLPQLWDVLPEEAILEGPLRRGPSLSWHVKVEPSCQSP